ncbi:hypothetical protein [Aureimonas sp. AU20]|uniref:hypothetical protein n=1 Tax=Aureimonas sp. AU20 TaxID=1349819 RepID=UPI000720F782|nr:hypothetical protein [Aureimonas sp. AU20]ALN72057.1 hypothetical protein M673_04970 [Aureimonas sp. AU20]
MNALFRSPVSARPFGAGLLSRAPRLVSARLPDMASGLPSFTSYGFGSANHLEEADQRGLLFPAGASALPLVTEDWFQGFFFGVDEMLRQQAVNFVLAAKGASGSSDVSRITLRGGFEAGGLTPLSVLVSAQNAITRGWGTGLNRSASLERGADYLLVYGQKGNLPFQCVVRVSADGEAAPDLTSLQVGTPNDGPSSWRYLDRNSTQPAWTAAGSYEFLSGLGGIVDIADGGNRFAAGGTVAGFFNVWGSFPFQSGLPDGATLLELAGGTLDPAGLAARLPGTLRFAADLKGPGDVAADPRGAVTQAMVETGKAPLAPPYAAAPLRRPPALRLRPFGDRFVLPLRDATRIGTVPFSGTYAGEAPADGFEVRLLRADTGAELVGWTALNAEIDKTARRFSGTLKDVPAAIAFRREIRRKGQPSNVVNGGDRLAIGLVLVDIGQSQLAYQGYAMDDTVGGGGGRQLAPTLDPNLFFSILKQPSSLHGQAQGFGGPKGSVALFQPYKADQHGDGNIVTFEAIRRLAGLPVMIVDTAVPGSHPNGWSFDRKRFAYATLFTPDGAATAFTFTPTAAGLSGEGFNPAPAVVPGSFAIRVGTIDIVDDGAGNLTGSGVTAGTIDYATGKVSNLTFAAAPASGTAVSGSFRFFATAPETSQTIAAGRWSLWGEEGMPLDRTNRTGRLQVHLARLRGVAPSLYRMYWYTSMESAAGNAGFPAVMDRFKARLDALYPQGADTPWGLAFPGRSASAEERLTYRPMALRQRQWAAARAFVRSLGDTLDLELANNTGPHPSARIGSRTLGERLGVGCAALFTPGLGAEGPVLRSARFTDSSRQAIELRFDLATGRALASADGSTSGLAGFRVAPPVGGSVQVGSGWLETGFSAAISGADRITLTASGSPFVAGQRVAFGNGSPIFTGSGATQEAVDNATLLKMPGDDDRFFAGIDKFERSGRRGNLLRPFDDVTVAEA